MDFKIAQSTLENAGIKALEKKTADIKKEQELKEACQGFESIFLNTILKSMRSTLPGNGLFNSHGLDIYKSMQDQYLAENISKFDNSIGMKEYLFNKLKESL